MTTLSQKHNRNPTIVEIMDLNNANSEHSRHGFFKGKQIIDGREQDKTLFDLVSDTLDAHPKVQSSPLKTIQAYQGYDDPHHSSGVTLANRLLLSRRRLSIHTSAYRRNP